jgi:hypothetical protein
MPYRITLRSSPGGPITGWYDGSEMCWSTDRRRQKLFEKTRDAEPVWRELRKRWPFNALVINIEAVVSPPTEERATTQGGDTVVELSGPV